MRLGEAYGIVSIQRFLRELGNCVHPARNAWMQPASGSHARGVLYDTLVIVLVIANVNRERRHPAKKA